LRPLEIVVIALAALYPIAGAVAPRARGVHALPLLAAVLGVVHVVVEGYRWQMVPVYLVIGAMALIGRRLYRKPDTGLQIGRSAPKRTGVFALIPVALMVLPPALVPVPVLPEPDGPYQVGTVAMHLIDDDRIEIYGPEPGGPRELMIQIWYPAVPGPDARPTSWVEDLEHIGPANAERLGFPSFVLDHLALAETHSYPDAALSDLVGEYPVVVYSHGWTGFRTVNVDQSEALASHGYVVVSIDHTYGSIMTVFPDGRAVPLDEGALPDEEDVGSEAYEDAAQQLVRVYAADIAFVLDSLEAMNGGDERFEGRLDLDRIGLFGHSTGGGAVVAACHTDERCAAGAGLDPWVEPVSETALAEGLAQPFLYVRSEEWTGYDNDGLVVGLYGRGGDGQYLASISGSEHWDFVVIPLLTPLAPQLGLKGPIDSERVMEINDTLLVSFFDAHLKGGMGVDVMRIASSFGEVVIEARLGGG
jgi:predicted dienelactone hydrolase